MNRSRSEVSRNSIAEKKLVAHLESGQAVEGVSTVILYTTLST